MHFVPKIHIPGSSVVEEHSHSVENCEFDSPSVSFEPSLIVFLKSEYELS